MHLLQWDYHFLWQENVSFQLSERDLSDLQRGNFAVQKNTAEAVSIYLAPL